MSDQEKFLTRWSRRKRDSAGGNARADRRAAADDFATQEMKSDQSIVASQPQAEVQPAPEFDLTKLPSLESIGADSDITAFFQPGVPSALRHAALRRAWSADPAIRDFIGPNENYWDAAGPAGVPGFGGLDADFDVERAVAELFEEVPPASEPNSFDSSNDLSAGGKNSTDYVEGEKSIPRTTTSATDGSLLPHCTENAATQKNSTQVPKTKMVRRHGSAIPK